MKKVLAALLSLMFIPVFSSCSLIPSKSAQSPSAVPAAEATPSPMELWQKAEEISGSWDSFDVDSSNTTEISFAGSTVTSSVEQRTKARGLTGGQPEYKVVCTGDNSSEYYYDGSKLFVSAAYGDYSSAMDRDGFDAFMESESISLKPEDFTSAVLVSEEGGAVIEFSAPTQEFKEYFAGEFGGSGILVHSDNMDAHGTVTLSDEGYVRNIKASFICSAVCYGNMDATFRIDISETLLSHNEDIDISVPAKLASYIEVDDISAYRDLYKALSSLQLSEGAEYSTSLTFDGSLAGVSATTALSTDAVFLADMNSGSLKYHSDASIYLAYNGSDADTSFTEDYDGGVFSCAYSDGSSNAEEVLAADMLPLVYADFLGGCSPDYLPDYHSVSRQYKDSDSVFSFGITDALAFMFYDQTLSCIRSDLSGLIYECTGYDQNDLSGMIIVTADGQLSYAVFYADLTIYFEDGSSVSGLAVCERTYKALGSDVSFPY